MEIITLFDVEVTRLIEQQSVFSEDEIVEEGKMVPNHTREWLNIHELIGVLSEMENDMNVTNIQIFQTKVVTLVNSEENDELIERIEELETKLSNAQDYIDDIESHLYDLREALSNVDYYLDEAEEDCQYAKNECEY